MIYQGEYMPEPRFATKRDPTAKTQGAGIAKIARALGKPFMPWQRYVVDVAGELEPNGDLRYEIVFVTVPRQSGKTTLVGPVQIYECVTRPEISTFYTAQTGKDAGTRWKDLVKLVNKSGLATMVHVRLSAGSQAIEWPNGSELRTFAPVDGALHGETTPLVTMDEIWKWDEALGDMLMEDAITPTQQIYEGHRQIWMISTAGTALSTFMKKWVARGRAGRSRMAYFEWALHDDDDPYDLEAIKRFHPAVGHTVTAESLLATGQGVDEETGERMSYAKWMRAFCNRWTEATDPVMPLEDWRELKGKQVAPLRSEIAVTYEIAPDSECGAVMASWRDKDGRPNNHIIHAAPGTVWMLDLLLDIKRKWKPLAFGADDGGPTRRLTDQLRRILKDPEAVTTTMPRDYMTACETWLNYAVDKELVHDGSTTLENGMAHLALARVGDATKFSRSQSTGPIVGPTSAAVGMWLYDHHDEGPGKPEIYGGED